MTIKTLITTCLLSLLLSPISNAGIAEKAYTFERWVVNTKINADTSTVETEELTTLINTQNGATSAPDDEITYNATNETLTVLEAYTISPTGEHIPVPKHNIHTKDQTSDSNYSEIDDTKVVSIIYPKVTVGSRTYYKALRKVREQSIENQYDLYVAFSPHQRYNYVEYTIEYSPKLKLWIDVKDLKGGRLSNGKQGQLRYKYTFSQPIAMSKETDEVDYEDFSPYLHFTTYPDPLAFGRAFELKAAPKATVDKDIQALADKITLGIADDYLQAKALYEWVSKEIRYVGDFIGENGYTPHDADYILHRRFGDCKDHNNLLITLLKAKNIQASSALINSDNIFTLTKLGTPSRFNHVITYLPKWDTYVDSTTGYAPFGILSGTKLDKPTLLTALNKVGHTKKFSIEDDKVINDVKLHIQPDGTITGTSESIFTGTKDIYSRNIYLDFEESDKQNAVNKHLKSYGESGTGTLKPDDANNFSTPYKVTGEFTLDPISNMPGNGAITIPVGLSKSIIKVKGWKTPEVKISFPFICESYYLEENTSIYFPSNVKITKIPDSVTFDKNGITYQANYQLKDNAVTVMRSLAYNMSSIICDSKDLDNWKVFHKVLKHDLRSQIIYE
jgi:transglutaminase-like putative cysteine protease